MTSSKTTNKPKLELRKFQLTGVAFLLNRIKKQGIGSGSLITDAVGLGKTIQVLTACHLAKLGTTCIVTKAGLKINFDREVKKWFSQYKTYIVDDWTSLQEIAKARNADFVIINYERLTTRPSKHNPNPKNWWEVILKYIQPAIIVADEAHKLKNSKISRHKAIRKLSEKAYHTILMMATPLYNNVEDLFGLLNLVDPTHFRNYRAYQNRFCRYSKGKFKTFLGDKNLRQLNKLITPLMIGRTKAEVIDELPKINKIPLILDIDNRAEYNRFLQETRVYNDTRAEGEAYKSGYMEALTIIGEGKLSPIIDWLKNWLEETDYKEKMVVASENVLLSQKLHETFKQESVMIIGSTANSKRMPYVDRFNEDDGCRFIFGNIESMGAGLNLDQKCNNLLVTQIPQSPGKFTQILGRIDRISSPYDCMNMWICYAPDTKEESKYKSFDKKAVDNTLAITGKIAHKDELLSTVLLSELADNGKFALE